MSGREWDALGRVARSYENRAVWVPYYDEGDETCFMHAGTLRQAKAYLARVLRQGTDERPVWRRIDPNTYEYGEWV